MGFPFREVSRNMILKFKHTPSSPILLKMIYGNTYVLPSFFFYTSISLKFWFTCRRHKGKARPDSAAWIPVPGPPHSHIPTHLHQNQHVVNWWPTTGLHKILVQ